MTQLIILGKTFLKHDVHFKYFNVRNPIINYFSNINQLLILFQSIKVVCWQYSQ